MSSRPLLCREQDIDNWMMSSRPPSDLSKVLWPQIMCSTKLHFQILALTKLHFQILALTASLLKDYGRILALYWAVRSPDGQTFAMYYSVSYLLDCALVPAEQVAVGATFGAIHVLKPEARSPSLRSRGQGWRFVDRKYSADEMTTWTRNTMEYQWSHWYTRYTLLVYGIH